MSEGGVQHVNCMWFAEALHVGARMRSHHSIAFTDECVVASATMGCCADKRASACKLTPVLNSCLSSFSRNVATSWALLGAEGACGARRTSACGKICAEGIWLLGWEAAEARGTTTRRLPLAHEACEAVCWMLLRVDVSCMLSNKMICDQLLWEEY